MSDSPLRQARGLAYRLLALKDRTEKQICDALDKKAFPLEVIADVVNELRAEGYVNDHQYARKYIAYHLESKPYGPYWLRSALVRAGIKKEIVDESLSVAFAPGKEETLASVYLKQLLQKNEINSQKAMRRLLSRGFSLHAAKHAILSMNLPLHDLYL